jgi:hypothetical protein
MIDLKEAARTSCLINGMIASALARFMTDARLTSSSCVNFLPFASNLFTAASHVVKSITVLN